MRDLRHDNIVAFVGACVDHPNISIITEYCSKGSLQVSFTYKNTHVEELHEYHYMVKSTLDSKIYIYMFNQVNKQVVLVFQKPYLLSITGLICIL